MVTGAPPIHRGDDGGGVGADEWKEEAVEEGGVGDLCVCM